jgi:hypothetical protein
MRFLLPELCNVSSALFLIIDLVTFILIFFMFSIGRKKKRKYFLIEPRPPLDAHGGFMDLKMENPNV